MKASRPHRTFSSVLVGLLLACNMASESPMSNDGGISNDGMSMTNDGMQDLHDGFLPGPHPDERIFSVALSSDGRTLYVGGGFKNIGAQPIRYLAKIRDGVVDPTFKPNPDDSVNSLVLSKDGSTLYVGGGFKNINGQPIRRLAKLNSDGMVDPNFKPNPGDGYVASLALNSYENILYVGGIFSNIGGLAIQNIAKVYTNGMVDATFGLSMEANVDEGFAEVRIESLALYGETALYVGGTFKIVRAFVFKNLVRLKKDGTLDLTFGPQPLYVRSIALSNDGNTLYVGGRGGSLYGYINKVKSDGTSNLFAELDNPVSSISLSADGSVLYVGGSFNTIATKSIGSLAKIKSDGTVDTTFNLWPFGQPQPYSVNSLAMNGDGSILYVGGWFDSIGGRAYRNLAKVRTDGTVLPFQP